MEKKFDSLRLKPKEEKPEGIQRHDPLSAEWKSILKMKELRSLRRQREEEGEEIQTSREI